MDNSEVLQHCVFLLLLLGPARADLSSEYENKVTLDSKYTLYWSYKATDGIMHMATEVRTTGWVSFGFTKTKSDHMDNYDVAIGKVEGGNGQIKDYLTSDHDIPPADLQQDYNLSFASEENGVTTLKFYRKVNTGDNKDLAIEPGEILTVWAYRTSDALNHHDQRGFQTITMIPNAALYLYCNQHLSPLMVTLLLWFLY